MNQNKKKLKICMVGQREFNDIGGVEKVVKELSTRIAQFNNYDVTCYCRRSENSHPKSKAYKYMGVHVKTVYTPHIKGLGAVVSSFIGCIKAAFGKYDVVHIHAEGPALWSWIIKLVGKKCVVTVHGLDWQREKWNKGLGSYYIKLGEKIAVKYADVIIVLSHAVQNYFKENYNRKTVFIPNGVDKPTIREADQIKTRWGLERNSYILSLGRIVPEKGLHYLIEAYQKIESDKKLVIAGDISDTKDYFDKLQELAGNDNRIIFIGAVRGKLLDELYSNAYLYVLPSDLEGMPLSLLEAMSYGNCCLVSDISECQEVVDDKAVTFATGNIYELQEKLQWLVDNPSIVNSYKYTAADYICRKYNWNDVVRKTLKAYRYNYR